MRLSLLIPGIVSAIYCVVVLFLVNAERGEHTGGFVNLQGIRTFLATFPGSILFEKLGRFNVKSNFQVGVSMFITAALIFGVLFLVLNLFHVN